MEITKELAIEIAQNAGDIHMREAGRTVWDSEDCAAATAVLNQLLVGVVQKMDGGPEDEQS